ncbi:MAG: type II toxin-antitoxin system RelB/DinJ family antitoxin [bacterium]|nr:type II toxin-antitoxin system RelB/DinJ family antitoxin [bacterium]
MSKSATIRARVEPELKNDVENIFKTLGLSATEAITMFYHMVKLKNGIPFEVRIPNPETQQVIRESREGINVTAHDDLDDYFEQIDRELDAEI